MLIVDGLPILVELDISTVILTLSGTLTYFTGVPSPPTFWSKINVCLCSDVQPEMIITISNSPNVPKTISFKLNAS